MKTCFKCGISKPLSAFYAHKQMADGHLNKCKDCAKDDARRRSMSPDAKAMHKLVAKRWSAENKEKCLASKVEWQKRNGEKRKAHNALNNAIGRGLIQKQPCFCCGETTVEAHHPDYSHPLDVVWLCHKHHKEAHRTFV